MKRTRLTTAVVLIVLIGTLGLAGPASAFQILATSGQTGDYGFLPADDTNAPGARCGYTAPKGDGYAHLRWVRIREPKAGARDVSGSRDHQQVSWQAKIQRAPNDASAWQNVAKSAQEFGTAYDDESAVFSPVKLYVHGDDVNGSPDLYRAIVTIKWWRHGAVEGVVKLWISYYDVKLTVGSSDYVFADWCEGVFA